MPRYIDAEPYEGMQIGKVIDVIIKASKNIAFGDIHGQDFVKVEQIDNIPTADVQEVKHGKWLDCGWHPNSIEGSAHFYKCSICAHKQIGMSNYCPRCGARMDGRIF